MEAGVVDTLMLFSLLVTNLYPWYLIPIVASLALWQSRRGLSYVFVGHGPGVGVLSGLCLRALRLGVGGADTSTSSSPSS